LQLDEGLVKAEKSSHYVRYLLIIGILTLSFSLSFMIRMQPMESGFELAEFDPFYNYRATEFIVENGLSAYLDWHDDLSWHPYGRDVSTTSQVLLHTTTAILYQTFGMGSSLHDFTVWFPTVISSLTVIVVFALVRTIGGTTAGFLASLFFAISPIIVMRGSMGWFKSEPLGLFYGLLAVYLLISAIKSDKGKVSIAKVVGGGILLAFGLASWGGIQFFILPIGFFFLALPFMRKDNKFIIFASVIFTSVFLLVNMLYYEMIANESHKLAVDHGYFLSAMVFTKLNTFFLVGCTAFLVACVLIKKTVRKYNLRIGLVLLGGTIIAGIATISSGAINLPTFRYLNAANPFLITTDMLTDSVSEHATTTIDLSFWFFSILMVFAGIGAWLLFQKKINRSFKIQGEMAAFALIIGFLGIYFSSAFVRLEVFGSISVIILSSIGLSILISKTLKAEHKPTSAVTKISFLVVIVVLLMIPVVYPESGNWANMNQGRHPAILNSATMFDVSTNDWYDAMQWLKENTPEDAVIASWWDYGYWISTLGERKTLADNATLIDWQIRKIASTYFSTPDNAWQILTSDARTDVSSYYVSLPDDISQPTQNSDNSYDIDQRKISGFKSWKGDSSPEKIYDPDMAAGYPTLFDYWESELYNPPPTVTGLDADYVLINLAVKKLSEENIMELYTLKQHGGDETKAFWFVKIADLPLMDYLTTDLGSFTDKFWNETLLGKLIPFTPVLYIDPSNPERQSDTYKPGYIAIYVVDVKFTPNGQGPFQLVYTSPSFHDNKVGPQTGPIIYKINKEYSPNQ